MKTVTIMWGGSSIPEEKRFVQTVEYQTQAELDAYLQGVDDMDGWADYTIIEDED